MSQGQECTFRGKTTLREIHACLIEPVLAKKITQVAASGLEQRY